MEATLNSARKLTDSEIAPTDGSTNGTVQRKGYHFVALLKLYLLILVSLKLEFKEKCAFNVKCYQSDKTCMNNKLSTLQWIQ